MKNSNAQEVCYFHRGIKKNTSTKGRVRLWKVYTYTFSPKLAKLAKYFLLQAYQFLYKGPIYDINENSMKIQWKFEKNVFSAFEGYVCRVSYITQKC